MRVENEGEERLGGLEWVDMERKRDRIEGMDMLIWDGRRRTGNIPGLLTCLLTCFCNLEYLDYIDVA